LATEEKKYPYCVAELISKTFWNSTGLKPMQHSGNAMKFHGKNSQNMKFVIQE